MADFDMKSQDVFESVREYIRAYHGEEGMICFDDHIPSTIGYGIQLVYDIDVRTAMACVHFLDRFETLESWREFVPQFINAVREHGTFKDDEWYGWMFSFVTNHTKQK